MIRYGDCSQDDPRELFDWWECVTFSPLNPVAAYKRRRPGQQIPMEAIMAGFTDDEEEDTSFVASYAEYENDSLCDEDLGTVRNRVSTGREFIKNSFFFDQNNPQGGVMAANRIDMNWDEGYLQYDILAGKSTTREALGEASSWFDEDVGHNECPYNEKAKFLVPNIYATLTSDVAFGSNKIGSSDYFFSERNPFDQAYQDDPITMASAIVLDNAVNPEYIGFRNNMNNLYAFNDIMSFCNATGAFWLDMMPITQMLNYFAHNVLTVLIPKQIVLIIDSHRGIAIPPRDYIPNIMNPVENIPDYNNKMKHVIELMKEIQSGRLFCTRLNGFYIKMSITPALTIVNFVLHSAPNYRLVLHLPTVDNQILYNSEVQNGIYPSRFTYENNPYWHRSRNHDNADDVLQSLQSNYHSKLLGMDGGELEEFMMVNNIRTEDSRFNPNIAGEMNVDSPGELGRFLL